MSAGSERLSKYFPGKEPGDPQIEVMTRLLDPYYLPSFEEVVGAFNFESGSDGQLTDWQRFIIGVLPYNMFECFTREHIEGLSEYLSRRIDELSKTRERPITILDACAGNGRLPYFINRHLTSLTDEYKFRVIAGDDGTTHQGGLGERHPPVYEVENIDYKSAIQKYKPDMVIASWIPSSDDERPSEWLDFFRKSPSVAEYILIGRSCWEDNYDYSVTIIPPVDSVPRYEQDGFKRLDHPNLQRYQLCEEDNYFHKRRSSNSTTVSFIRK